MQVKCTRGVLSLLAKTAYHSHVDRRGLGIEVNPNELLPGFEGESRDLAQIRNFMRKSSITTNGREQHIFIAPLQRNEDHIFSPSLQPWWQEAATHLALPLWRRVLRSMFLLHY